MTFDPNDGENVLIRYNELVKQTDGAYLIETVDTATGEVTITWLPKSQVAKIDHSLCELWIPLWLAESRELEYE